MMTLTNDNLMRQSYCDKLVREWGDIVQTIDTTSLLETLKKLVASSKAQTFKPCCLNRLYSHYYALDCHEKNQCQDGCSAVIEEIYQFPTMAYATSNGRFAMVSYHLLLDNDVEDLFLGRCLSSHTFTLVEKTVFRPLISARSSYAYSRMMARQLPAEVAVLFAMQKMLSIAKPVSGAVVIFNDEYIEDDDHYYDEDYEMGDNFYGEVP